MKILFLFLCGFAVISCATRPCAWPELYEKSSHCDQDICPPDPPEAGPGSAIYPHASLRRLVFGEGPADPLHSVVYIPEQPAARNAPLVLFLHGYFDAEPEPYETMLQHMARKGFIVIYPSYGHPLQPQDWAMHARNALQHALKELKNRENIQPDLTRTAFVGHSIGGILALHLAQENALQPNSELPQPRLIITLDAAGRNSLAYPFISIDQDKLRRLPKQTWLLLIMAEETYQYRLKDPDLCLSERDPPSDNCNAFAFNRLAFLKTPGIPLSQKSALLIPSDQEGDAQLRSEHNAVQGDCGFFAKPIDAVDTWGYWKLTVGALSHVLLGNPVDYAFADTEARRAFGYWSNGRKARPIVSLQSCFQEGACPP
jgi:predicted alpha/beta hydrolase family esterase